MIDLTRQIIQESNEIKEAFRKLNLVPQNLTLFVTNADGKMVGTLTDGDIRRGFLRGLELSDPVEKFMCYPFQYITDIETDPAQIKKIKNKGIKLLPVLDNTGKILRVIDFSKVKTILPLDAILMAGGRGERLKPLTDKIPKSLLMVGNKSIIDHNLDHLRQFGIRNFYITLNYLAEMIEQQIGNGNDNDLKINYIHETEPLGTFGSVRLINKFEHNIVLVMNADLFTNIDLEGFYENFIEQKADMSIATIPYTVDVPYGVLNINDERVKGFREKPTYTYHSNAGIYLFRSELIKTIPVHKSFDATDFLQTLIDNGKIVIRYPIIGYWIDIGKPEDYKKVQEIAKHIRP
jgi:dTDP-glucose pyrophosphorylase